MPTTDQTNLPTAEFKLIAGAHTQDGVLYKAGRPDGFSDVVESAIDLEDCWPEKFKFLRGPRERLKKISKNRAPSAEVRKGPQPAHVRGATVTPEDVVPTGTEGNKGVATEADVERPRGHGPASHKK